MAVSLILHILLLLLVPGLQPIEWEASPPESLEITYKMDWQEAEAIPEQPEGPPIEDPEPVPEQPEEDPEPDEPDEPDEPVEPEPDPEPVTEEPEQPDPEEQDVEEPVEEQDDLQEEPEPAGEPEEVVEPEPEPVEPERELLDPGELAAGEIDPDPVADGDAVDRDLMQREFQFARQDQDREPAAPQQRAAVDLLEYIEETSDVEVDWEQAAQQERPLIMEAVEPEETDDEPTQHPVVFDLPTPGDEVVDADEESPASPSPQDEITDRRALSQPLPEMPAWLEEEGTSVSVLVEFEINEEGEVHRRTLRTSSGYPELDDLVLSTVGEWKYEPGPSGDTRLAAFRFELRPGGGFEPAAGS